MNIGDIVSIKGFDKNGNVVIEFDDACLNDISVTSETTQAYGGLGGNAKLEFVQNKILEFTGQAKSCNVHITREEAFKSAVEDFSEPRPVTNNTIVKPNQKDDYEIFEPINTLASALHNVGVSVAEADGSFRTMSDILNDLGNKWDDLDDIQKGCLLASTPSSYKECIIPVKNTKPVKIAFEGDIDNFSLDKLNSNLDEVLDNLIAQIEPYTH